MGGRLHTALAGLMFNNEKKGCRNDSAVLRRVQSFNFKDGSNVQ